MVIEHDLDHGRCQSIGMGPEGREIQDDHRRIEIIGRKIQAET